MNQIPTTVIPYRGSEWAVDRNGEWIAIFKGEAKAHEYSEMLNRGPLGEDERNLIVYALNELSNRRYEQAIDHNNPMLRNQGDDLRALADTIRKNTVYVV